MLTIDQLKGLSTLLMRLNVCNGNTCQEVQALQAEGGRVLVSANDSNEVSALSVVLGGIGVGTADWKTTLKPAFLAQYQFAKKSRGVPPVVQMRKLIWTDHDYMPGLEALATLDEWKDDVAKLNESKLINRSKSNKEDALKLEIRTGYGHFKLTGSNSNRFSVTSGTNQLEVGKEGQLALVEAASGNNTHAEQSLLLKFAHHLALGGQAFDVRVAGAKRPCAVCEEVITRYKAAFNTAYQKTISSDENTDQPQWQHANSDKIALPECSLTEGRDSYDTFATDYPPS